MRPELFLDLSQESLAAKVQQKLLFLSLPWHLSEKKNHTRKSLKWSQKEWWGIVSPKKQIKKLFHLWMTYRLNKRWRERAREEIRKRGRWWREGTRKQRYLFGQIFSNIIIMVILFCSLLWIQCSLNRKRKKEITNQPNLQIHCHIKNINKINSAKIIIWKYRLLLFLNFL